MPVSATHRNSAVPATANVESGPAQAVDVGEAYVPSHKLFIGNVGFDCKDDQFKAFFETFGPVRVCRRCAIRSALFGDSVIMVEYRPVVRSSAHAQGRQV